MNLCLCVPSINKWEHQIEWAGKINFHHLSCHTHTDIDIDRQHLYFVHLLTHWNIQSQSFQTTISNGNNRSIRVLAIGNHQRSTPFEHNERHMTWYTWTIKSSYSYKGHNRLVIENNDNRIEEEDDDDEVWCEWKEKEGQKRIIA